MDSILKLAEKKMGRRVSLAVALLLATICLAQSAKAAGLTAEKLKNTTIVADDMVGDGKHAIPFAGGSYKNGSDSAGIDAVAIGDLDGDKVDDGAVTYFENFGGSGYFGTMTVFLSKGGKAAQIGDRCLGDRTAVKKLSIKNRVLILDVMAHGPNDSASIPTVHKVLKYRVKGEKLIGSDKVND
jgi:hypothetical protein